MQMIHTGLGKSKKRKPNAKQRELAAEWEKLLKKYETKPTRKPAKLDTNLSPVVTRPYVRSTRSIPSLDTGLGVATRKENPVYTGTMIKGIGTMHKSNAVPIFSDEQAIEIATMRRG
jgi:transketolase